MPSNNSAVWIESTGGPLILLERRLLPYWRGYSPSFNTGATDYERACSVSDYLGTIDVGLGKGIVLGEQPYATTWWRCNDVPSGMLVRWVSAESEEAVIEALRVLSNVAWERTGVELKLATGNLALFDSAFPGNEIDVSLSIEIPAGIYFAETLHYSPNDEISLILHRFITRPDRLKGKAAL